MGSKGGRSSESRKMGERVMFVSLFMILLAFFILLNSIAKIQEERKKQAIESLGGAFGYMPSGLSLFDTASEAPNPPGPPLKPETEQDRLMDQLRRIFTGKLGAGVEVRPAATGNGALIEVGTPTVFSGTSTELPADLADRIRRMADLVSAANVEVIVRGYTNLRLQSDFRDALWVSGRRAQNVARLFRERGVPMERLRLEGRGDLRPAAEEYSEEGRRKNERVQIRLKIQEDSSLRPLFPEGDLAPSVEGGGNGQE
ncbi:OmpA family protein [Thiohalorhabdus sp. Cl-TMA]|uniref:OmpA family protein n=1 Tax=Thiohalorhabdus methylotrophus TaxID=3242694 RepID=A0ABV4TW14_9GAMM